jgi:hypothetical protein
VEQFLDRGIGDCTAIERIAEPVSERVLDPAHHVGET